MPDELPRTGLGRRLSDPNEAAEISEADIDRAIQLWKRDASPRGRDLVDPAVKTDTDTNDAAKKQIPL